MHQSCQQHLWGFSIPVSRNLLEERSFNVQSYVNTHAMQMLVESIHEKFGYRFFVAHLRDEVREEGGYYSKVQNLVYFRQHWLVTLH